MFHLVKCTPSAVSKSVMIMAVTNFCVSCLSSVMAVLSFIVFSPHKIHSKEIELLEQVQKVAASSNGAEPQTADSESGAVDNYCSFCFHKTQGTKLRGVLALINDTQTPTTDVFAAPNMTVLAGSDASKRILTNSAFGVPEVDEEAAEEIQFPSFGKKSNEDAVDSEDYRMECSIVGKSTHAENFEKINRNSTPDSCEIDVCVPGSTSSEIGNRHAIDKNKYTKQDSHGNPSMAMPSTNASSSNSPTPPPESFGKLSVPYNHPCFSESIEITTPPGVLKTPRTILKAIRTPISGLIIRSHGAMSEFSVLKGRERMVVQKQYEDDYIAPDLTTIAPHIVKASAKIMSSGHVPASHKGGVQSHAAKRFFPSKLSLPFHQKNETNIPLGADNCDEACADAFSPPFGCPMMSPNDLSSRNTGVGLRERIGRTPIMFGLASHNFEDALEN